jgi:hypothetical protein
LHLQLMQTTFEVLASGAVDLHNVMRRLALVYKRNSTSYKLMSFRWDCADLAAPDDVLGTTQTDESCQ